MRAGSLAGGWAWSVGLDWIGVGGDFGGRTANTLPRLEDADVWDDCDAVVDAVDGYGMAENAE